MSGTSAGGRKIAFKHAERRKQKNCCWTTDENGIVHIPLGHGYVALIDKQDEIEAKKYLWRSLITPRSKTVYASAHLPGTRASTIKLHQVVLRVDSSMQVDHKNGDGLNCVRSNLRPATGSQNCSNRLSRATLSPYRGVIPKNNCERWEAYIKVDQKRKYLGLFTSAEDAALAYNNAALLYFGEFAVLNEIAEMP